MANLSRDRDAGPHGPLANDSQSCAVIPEIRPVEVSDVQRRTKNDPRWRSRSPAYRSWEHAKERCSSTRRHNAHRYIGRGIKMCARWLSSFDAFLEDMGPRPNGTTLDRKDNDGHYSCGSCEECVANRWPPNCQWATRAQQNRNQERYSSALVAFRGESLSVEEWARRFGIPAGTVRSRLKCGLSIEEALSEGYRPRPIKRFATFRGETLSLRDWAIRLGLSKRTIVRRIATGLPLDAPTRKGPGARRRMTDAANHGVA